jgi:hypothetical protein
MDLQMFIGYIYTASGARDTRNYRNISASDKEDDRVDPLAVSAWLTCPSSRYSLHVPYAS